MTRINKLSLLSLLPLLTLTVQACGGNQTEGNVEQSTSQATVKKYNVTFDGTSMNNQQIEEGSKLNQPADPEKTNCIFGGWYTDSTYKTEVNFPLTINQDTTIYAQFNTYKQAFSKAREKTIGDEVSGYEFDYTIDASANYSALSLSGNTTGTSRYSTTGDVSFYDEHVNSGLLFNDGSKYQIKNGNSLQKVELNENGVLVDYSVAEVDASYKYDSSSFAKALFEYTNDQLKSIEKTNVANEYKLNTSFNFSKGFALVGNYLNHPLIEKALGPLPETSVNTGMYVTFSNGEVKSYRYVMNVNVTSISFNLVYNLTFKNVGKASVITPKTFSGLSLSSEEINNTKNEILGYINSFKQTQKSSYDFNFKTGVGFEGKNDINVTVKGSTLRKVTGSESYFHNDIEIDTDLKNADLYKAAGIADIHIKKTKLSTGEVYNIEKKTLSSDANKVESYTDNNNDLYYMLGAIGVVSNIRFVQKEADTKTNKVTYAVGLAETDVKALLDWFNANISIDPLDKATTDVAIFGDYTASTLVVDEAECVITLQDGAFSSLEINVDGEFSTRYVSSRDFTATAPATYYLNYKIEKTTDGATYEPYDTVKAAK